MIGLRNYKSIAVAAVLAAGAASLGTSADASTCKVTFNNGNGNGNGFAEYSLTTSSALACASGNSSADALGGLPDPFTIPPEWSLSSKGDIKNGNLQISGSGPISFTTTPEIGSNGGTWAIDLFPENTQIAITLKSGNSFAAFLLTPFIRSGTWTSEGSALSNFSVFYRDCAGLPASSERLGCGTRDEDNGNGPSPVPLPAAGWLLLGGLAGLVGLRRRR